MSITSDSSMARIVYVLHLVGVLTGGLTAVIGVIFAHLYAGQAPSPLRDHFRFQYRTFWIGLLYNLIAGIVVLAFFNWLLMLAIALWWVVRCVRGLSALERGEPPVRIDSFGF